MNRVKEILSILLCGCIALGTVPRGLADEAQNTSSTAVQSAQPSAAELQQLVAPIALYPDALVAQILAAATYPDEVVEADRWMQQHPDLKGEQLAQEVDQQPWDPSVKALTEFPSVLANLDKNLSWTSSLGDAYINHQQEVMNAVQEMRKRAQEAGNLKSTSQQTVSQQGETIVIEPADPDIIYVPQYDPWIVYGYPVVAWPGWYWYPGLFVPGPGIVLGVGFGVGFFGGFGWGWHHWAPDWHHRVIVFNHNTYISRSRTFVNRNYYLNRAHVSAFHAVPAFHRSPLAAPHSSPGTHSGAFSGFGHGGVARGYSWGGRSSFGAGFHGGFHGSGFHHR